MTTPKYDELLTLADLLETKVPEGRFDYARWVGEDWGGAQDLSCGTTACALGWAAVLMPHLGLRLREGTFASHVYCLLRPELSPIYAAATTFGLVYSEAWYLFNPEMNSHDPGLPKSPGPMATASEVAAHIRRFVAWRKGMDTTHDQG